MDHTLTVGRVLLYKVLHEVEEVVPKVAEVEEEVEEVEEEEVLMVGPPVVLEVEEVVEEVVPMVGVVAPPVCRLLALRMMVL